MNDMQFPSLYIPSHPFILGVGIAGMVGALIKVISC